MASCGGWHTLVVTQDGGLWACGAGEDGQLGLNNEENRLVFERVGGNTGVAFGAARVVAAAAGGDHSAVVTGDGALWTWGSGGDGRLGHGDGECRLVPTEVSRSALDDKRIKRCRPLSDAHKLAMAMGTHDILGARSPLMVVAGEVGLVAMIAQMNDKCVSGVAGECEGLVRLLGGVSAQGRQS
jgi:alpha-tubulin suppressor-like RCC1 family protein